MTKRAVWMACAALLSGVALTACGGDDNDNNPPVDAGNNDAGSDAGTQDAGTDAGTDAGADAGTDAGVDAGAPDAGSFVAIGVRVQGATSRSIYLGAYPNNVPAGALDAGAFTVQYANADLSFANGDAYVWDRNGLKFIDYSVTDAGVLVDGGIMDLSATGVKNLEYTAHFSATEAVSFDATQGALFLTEWDPSTMSITNVVPDLPLGGPTTTLTDGGTGYQYSGIDINLPAKFGKYVAFPLNWVQSDGSDITRNLTVGLVDSSDATLPLTIVNDARCIGATQVWVDAAGDLYVAGTGQLGRYQLFPPAGFTPPDACILRIKAGTTTFDTTFNVDLMTATGTKAIWQAWYAGSDTALVVALNPAYTVTTYADYSANATFKPFLINLLTGAATALPGLPITGVTLSYQYRLDGNLYYQDYNTKSTSTTPANTTVYEVEADGGVTAAFTAPGDLWGLGRMTAK